MAYFTKKKMRTYKHLRICTFQKLSISFFMCWAMYIMLFTNPKKKQFFDFPNYFLHFVWRNLNKPQNGKHWTCLFLHKMKNWMSFSNILRLNDFKNGRFWCKYFEIRMKNLSIDSQWMNNEHWNWHRHK